MLQRSIASAVALSLLYGCAADSPGRADGGAAAERVPFQSAAGEANYHMLLAELALQRGMGHVAAREYAAAAALSDDADLAARAASVAFELGENDLALEASTRWLALDRESPEARRLLVSLHIRRGEAAPAYGYLAELIARVPAAAGEAFGPITGLLMLETNAATTLDVMQRLVADHPDEPQAQYGLATLALRAGRDPLALAAARLAVGLAPDWPQAAMLLARTLVTIGEYAAGLAIAAERASAPGADASLRLEYAILLTAAGNDLEARAELDRVLAISPRHPGALRAAGLLALRHEQIDDAEQFFTELLATGTQTLDAFFFLARIADDRGQLERALRLYSRVRGGDYAVPAQVRVGQLLYEEGRGEDALAHLRLFGEDNPQYDVEMISARGALMKDMGNSEGALALYTEALETRPDSEALMYARAFLYEDLDRVDEAVAELRVLVRRLPEDATALNALGYTLADRTTRYREAYRYIRKALALEPENPAIIDSMGWVEYRRGRYDRALEHLQRAYALVPDSEIAAHLGEVLWVTGDTEAALTIWEDALARDPGSAALVNVIQRFRP